LATLDLAEVAQGYTGAAGNLAQGLALLQAEVAQNITDFLTY
jgi:hypothetical protein